MTIGYLALGSNLGDRLDYLKQAVNLLNQDEHIQVIKKSAIYETKPYGEVPQDNYLNAVVKIETSYEPLTLLQQTQAIEAKLERKRLIHWGPRTIDIDILLLENQEVNKKELSIPHKEIKKRSFVLIPLRDVYAHEKLFEQTFDELIEATGNKKEVWKNEESW